jgi:hypothetical protein
MERKASKTVVSRFWFEDNFQAWPLPDLQPAEEGIGIAHSRPRLPGDTYWINPYQVILRMTPWSGISKALQTDQISNRETLSAKNSVNEVYASIRNKNPTMKLSQMSDASVARMTLPICVEVGEPGKSYTEASVQLGV